MREKSTMQLVTDLKMQIYQLAGKVLNPILNFISKLI